MSIHPLARGEHQTEAGINTVPKIHMGVVIEAVLIEAFYSSNAINKALQGSNAQSNLSGKRRIDSYTQRSPGKESSVESLK